MGNLLKALGRLDEAKVGTHQTIRLYAHSRHTLFDCLWVHGCVRLSDRVEKNTTIVCKYLVVIRGENSFYVVSEFLLILDKTILILQSPLSDEEIHIFPLSSGRGTCIEWMAFLLDL